MKENLIFRLNATMPIFLMMVVGYMLKRIKWLDEKSTGVLNKLVFSIFLPALLFMDLAKQDFVAIWDSTFVLFCAIVTIISIIIAALLSLTDKDRDDRGEIIQASYRSAACFDESVSESARLSFSRSPAYLILRSAPTSYRVSESLSSGDTCVAFTSDIILFIASDESSEAGTTMHS